MEQGNRQQRWATFLLYVGHLWPQYRALRVLILGWKKDKTWYQEKELLERDLSSLGKILQKKPFQIHVVICHNFLEPFLEAVPQLHILLCIWVKDYSESDEGRIIAGDNELLFSLTFALSVTTACLGISKLSNRFYLFERCFKY